MNPYVKAINDAADIAARIASEHNARRTQSDKCAAALEVQSAILKHLMDMKAITYTCGCNVEHIEHRGQWGFFIGEEYPK